MKNATVYASAATAKGIATKKAKADGKEYSVKPFDEGYIVVAKPAKAAKAPKAPKADPNEVFSAGLKLVKETPSFLYVEDSGVETFLIKSALVDYEVNDAANRVTVSVTAKYAKKRPDLFAFA